MSELHPLDLGDEIVPVVPLVPVDPLPGVDTPATPSVTALTVVEVFPVGGVLAVDAAGTFVPPVLPPVEAATSTPAEIGLVDAEAVPSKRLLNLPTMSTRPLIAELSGAASLVAPT